MLLRIEGVARWPTRAVSRHHPYTIVMPLRRTVLYGVAAVTFDTHRGAVLVMLRELEAVAVASTLGITSLCVLSY